MVEPRAPHPSPPLPSSDDDARASNVHDAGFDGLLRQAAHVSATDFAYQWLELPLGSTVGGGRFQVLRHLGRGGMGTVYEVFDAERREKVALKLLSRLGSSGRCSASVDQATRPPDAGSARARGRVGRADRSRGGRSADRSGSAAR
jgi:hypothetical protein